MARFERKMMKDRRRRRRLRRRNEGRRGNPVFKKIKMEKRKRK